MTVFLKRGEKVYLYGVQLIEMHLHLNLQLPILFSENHISKPSI